MGDGRYYTYRQFFQILYLTALSGGLVFNIFYIQIKSREKERIRYIVISSCFLLATIMLSFIKEVTYELYPAEILTYISLFGIIGAIVTQIVYYNKKVVLTLLLTIVAIGLTGFRFISAFTFVKTTYTIEYQLLIVSTVLILLSYIFMDIRKSYQLMIESSKRKGFKRYQWLESLTIGAGILITVTSYCFHILLDYSFPLHEICLLVCIVGLNVTFQKFMPHERIPSGYHSLIENMVDTIIIVNEKRDILYMNDTELSKLIKQDIKIDFLNLIELFKLENKSIIRLNNNVEQVNGIFNGEVVSCKISYKSIENKGEHVGFVIVIEDCTHLELMINDLRDRRRTLRELEIELLQYSRTSQVLQAEKERNRLLIEVQNELGHHLAELTKYIGNTIDYGQRESLQDEENCEYYVESIVQGITMARKNLSKIRETVKTYRSSYDGKDKSNDKSIASR